MDQQILMNSILRLCRVMHRNPSGSSYRISHGAYRITNAVMADEGIRIVDLANRLGIRPSSLTNSLKKLEEKGYIYRVQDENDSRSYHIYTTELTRREHKLWMEEQRETAKQMNILTEAEAQMFCILCDKLSSHLEALSEGKGREEKENR